MNWDDIIEKIKASRNTPDQNKVLAEVLQQIRNEVSDVYTKYKVGSYAAVNLISVVIAELNNS